MALRLYSNLPYGNAQIVSITSGEESEVIFAAEPRGGPEAMWFYFKLVESDPVREDARKVRLVLRFYDNMLGAGIVANLAPVSRAGEQAWSRMRPGKAEVRPDGQTDVVWVVPHPSPNLEMALCFPYGKPEIDHLVAKSRGAWNCDAIGVSPGGRPIHRICSDYSSDGARKPGIYMVARQHSGETPGSWVMDGALQHFARAKRVPVVWAVPFVDVDGVAAGNYGKDGYPYDLNRAWGEPPRRHETLAIQRDMQRWKQRCEPMLALDFHAPGISETDGIYTFVPDPERDAAVHQKALKWANVIGQELGQDYAAQDFKRVARYKSRWDTPTFTGYCNFDLGVPAVSIETPYSMIGQTPLTQKSYREAGSRIANAVLKRLDALAHEK